MAYMGSDYYTAHAYDRAKNIGIDLTPEVGRALVEKIQQGAVFWESPPEPSGNIPIFINHMNRRIRLIVNEDKNRIITLADRSFATHRAIEQAERLGLTLNLALASLIMEKVKAKDVIEIGQNAINVGEAKMVVADVGLRVFYSEDAGTIIKVDDYTGPRTAQQHPAVSRHAAERAIQRYDVELTPEVSEMIVRRIMTGEDLIDHYQSKSGAMVAIMEIAPEKPACIIYHHRNGSIPIQVVTVTPMTYHEAHSEKILASRKAEQKKRFEDKRERRDSRLRDQKKEAARIHRAMRDDHDEFSRYG